MRYVSTMILQIVGNAGNAVLDKIKSRKVNKRNYFAAFCQNRVYYAFTPLYSSDTVNFLRPLARRAANTRRPFAVAILSRKPCLFLLFLLEGWNVLFIFVYTILCYYSMRSGCKISDFFFNNQSAKSFLDKSFCVFSRFRLILQPYSENKSNYYIIIKDLSYD